MSKIKELKILLEQDKSKTLYKGTFNWKGESHIFHKQAYSEAQAKVLMIKELEKTLKRTDLFGVYSDKNLYKIEKV